MGWRSQPQAWAMTQAQFAWYREMEAANEMVQITGVKALRAHVSIWESALARKDGSHLDLFPRGVGIG